MSPSKMGAYQKFGAKIFPSIFPSCPCTWASTGLSVARRGTAGASPPVTGRVISPWGRSSWTVTMGKYRS